MTLFPDQTLRRSARRMAAEREQLSPWAKKRGRMNDQILHEGQKDHAWIYPIYAFCIFVFACWAEGTFGIGDMVLDQVGAFAARFGG